MAEPNPPEQGPNSAPHEPVVPANPPSSLPYSGFWPVLAGVVYGITMRFVYSGVKPPGTEAESSSVINGMFDAYTAMMASFIYVVPFLAGMVTVFVAEMRSRRTWSYYFSAGVSLVC